MTYVGHCNIKLNDHFEKGALKMINLSTNYMLVAQVILGAHLVVLRNANPLGLIYCMVMDVRINAFDFFKLLLYYI